QQQRRQQSRNVHQPLLKQPAHLRFLNCRRAQPVIPRNPPPRRDDQQQTENPDRHRRSRNDPQVLAHQHFPLLNRLAHQRQHRPVLDLLVDRLAGREQRRHQYQNQNHVKPDGFEQDRVLPEREERQGHVDDQDRSRQPQ